MGVLESSQSLWYCLLSESIRVTKPVAGISLLNLFLILTSTALKLA